MKKSAFYTSIFLMFFLSFTILPAQEKSNEKELQENQKQLREALIKLEQAKLQQQKTRNKLSQKAQEQQQLSKKEQQNLQKKLEQEMSAQEQAQLHYKKALEMYSRRPEVRAGLSEEKLRELQYKMQELQQGRLQEVQEKLRDVNLRHLRHMAELELPELNIEIPEIDFAMPDFNIEIPDIDFEGMEEYFDDEGYIHIEPGRTTIYRPDGARKLFRDLGEDEQIKIQAVYALDKKNAAATLPVLQKLLEREASPAIRYAATRKLRYFLNEEKSVDMLGNIARNDPNVKVRKQAIILLGKNGSKKAKAILQDLAK